MIAAVCAGVVALARLRARHRIVVISVAGAVALVATGFVGGRPPPLLPPAGLRVVFLDVGQGDSALLQVPQGSILVDQGPPEAEVARQLRRLGVRRLGAMVLTHPQRDHVGGAADVLRSLRVGLGPRSRAPGRERGRRLAMAEAHDAARAGGRPRGRRLPPRSIDGSGALARRAWSARRGSERLRGRVARELRRDGRFLPADAESNVTARLRLPAVEVLKVAHHGSEDEGLADQLSAPSPADRRDLGRRGATTTATPGRARSRRYAR